MVVVGTVGRLFISLFCVAYVQLALTESMPCSINCNETLSTTGLQPPGDRDRRLPQVCASDGRTYDTRCTVLWYKQCRGLRLKIQHQGPCANRTDVKCEEQRQAAKRHRRQERLIANGGSLGLGDAEKIYVPRCNADGTFAKMQCAAAVDREQWCWCSELDGRPVASTLGTRPKCNGVTASVVNCTSPSTVTAFMRHVLLLLQGEFRAQTEARLPTSFGSSRAAKPRRPSKDNQLLDRIPLILTRTNERVSLDGSQPARHWKFVELDKSHDDRLDQTEFRNFELQLFHRFLDPSVRSYISCVNNISVICDGDGDGSVNRTEWDACFGTTDSKVAPRRLNSSDSSDAGFPNGTNSDASVGRAKSCRDARKEAQEFNRNVRHETTQFVPKCNVSNTLLYQQVQCHAYARNSTFCWCVDSRTGVQIGRASILTRRDGADGVNSVNCSAGAVKQLARPTIQPVLPPLNIVDDTREFKGCPDSEHPAFLNAFARQLIAEMNQQSGTNRTKSKLDSGTLRWKFNRLDKNRNGLLDRNEWKPLRNLLSRSGKPSLQKCMRNFPKFCDADDSQALTLDELSQCAQSSDENSMTKRERERKRYETNPLTILKP